MTVRAIENRFIPSFIFSSAVLAVFSPYLPILLRCLGYTPLWVGILFGILEGAGIAGPLLFGYWADKTGNYRPVLIISCLLPALVAFPLIVWVNPAVSIILLIFFAMGVRSAVSLLDAITTIQIGKTGNYGRIRVWGSISFILFTLYLQWTPVLKPDNAGNISLWLIIAAVMSVMPIMLLPRDLLKSSARPDAEEMSEGISSPLMLMHILGGCAVIFLGRLSMTAIYTYLPLYLTEALRWNAVGLMFALAAASEVPFMFLSGALIRRFGSLPLLVLSAAGVCLRLLILAFLPFKPCIIVSQLLHSLCFGIFHPAAVHFFVGIFPVKKRGTGMSVYLILGSGLPALVSNITGGIVVQAVGYQSLFALYAAIAGAAVLIGIIVQISRRRGVLHPS